MSYCLAGTAFISKNAPSIRLEPCKVCADYHQRSGGLTASGGCSPKGNPPGGPAEFEALAGFGGLGHDPAKSSFQVGTLCHCCPNNCTGWPRRRSAATTA